MECDRIQNKPEKSAHGIGVFLNWNVSSSSLIPSSMSILLLLFVGQSSFTCTLVVISFVQRRDSSVLISERETSMHSAWSVKKIAAFSVLVLSHVASVRPVTFALGRWRENSIGRGPLLRGSQTNAKLLYASPSHLTSSNSGCEGCHSTLVMFAWYMSTARSSDVGTSQIQMVLGASSSLDTKRVDEESNRQRLHPDRASKVVFDDRPGGLTA